MNGSDEDGTEERGGRREGGVHECNPERGGGNGAWSKGMIQYDKRGARQKVGCEEQERERVTVKFVQKMICRWNRCLYVYYRNVVVGAYLGFVPSHIGLNRE